MVDHISLQAIKSKENEESFYYFARENHDFILRCASRTCHRFITENDDEWSIALIAFYEAVKTYDENKGVFKNFAALVIKRRLMDYFDKESRHRNEIATEPYTFDSDIDLEDATPYQLEVARKSGEASAHTAVSSSLKDEIDALQGLLRPYGFSLHDIGGCSPKSVKTKRACAFAIDALVSSPLLFERLRRTRNLPYMELLKVQNVTKKILERHRKYIIAAAEILVGDFPLLAEYMGHAKQLVKAI